MYPSSEDMLYVILRSDSYDQFQIVKTQLQNRVLCEMGGRPSFHTPSESKMWIFDSEDLRGRVRENTDMVYGR